MAHKLSSYGGSHAEALSYFPEPDQFALGADRYLEQIALIKRAVRIPVIGSLNGTSASGWLRYARLIEQAGADALELNVYHVATDSYETGTQVESRVETLPSSLAAGRMDLPPHATDTSAASTSAPAARSQPWRGDVVEMWPMSPPERGRSRVEQPVCHGGGRLVADKAKLYAASHTVRGGRK